MLGLLTLISVVVDMDIAAGVVVGAGVVSVVVMVVDMMSDRSSIAFANAVIRKRGRREVKVRKARLRQRSEVRI